MPVSHVETIKELALEPVPRSLIESAISHLPVVQKSSHRS